MSVHRTLYLLLLGLFVGACASTGDKTQAPLNSAAELYQEGRVALQGGYFDTAIEKFEQLETRYPFGEYAQQAQLDMAYAYYKSNNPESAVAAAERFIKNYPRHPDVAYAYYIRGLANFVSGGDLIDRRLGEDPAQRDPRPAQESFRSFSELVKRFPDSPYSADARLRMIYLRNFLARHEIYVARFYMRRGAYIAALNRARTVLETYYQSTSVPEALSIMARAYQKMGLKKLAGETLAVLKLNYPELAKQQE